MLSSRFLLALAVAAVVVRADQIDDARNRQDRGYIRWVATQAEAAAKKNPKDAGAQYRLAQAESLRAEVALEVHDKEVAKTAAEDGIAAAQRAVDLQPRVAEYHRILGTLCGQVIPPSCGSPSGTAAARATKSRVPSSSMAGPRRLT